VSASAVIWKFQIPVADDFKILMPSGARLLDVQAQHGVPQLWAVVIQSNPMVPRSLALRGTGHPADGLVSAVYVGTFQVSGGGLVFHLFDLGEVAG